MKLPEERNPVIAGMIEGAARMANAEAPRTYLGMSGIGDRCARKIWYSFRGYSPKAPDGRLQMIFKLGYAVEDLAIKALRAGGFNVEGQQEAFSALNGFFRGHCDGFIDGVTQRRHVLEIKSASSSRFKAFQTSGVAAISPTYLAQLQCYMGYSGVDRGIWVVMNKDNCSIYTERLEYDKGQFERIEARARNIINANTPPERAYEANDMECQRCDYAGHCWTEGPYIQTRKTCGTCNYCQFDNLEPSCVLHDRKIAKWGCVCPQWLFRDECDVVPF